MIQLFTGLPGNGKTLYVLWYVKNWITQENAERIKAGQPIRDIFYHGISHLMLPWTRINPQQWMDCPPGSVIVMDEAQFVFERKPNGAKLPVFYEKLAVHRHSGYDIILITQGPSLIDQFVRKLVGRHMHVVRTFGMERAVIHEWAAVRDNPEKPANRKDAIKHFWRYPKEVYAYYKSAEQHTVRRHIPAKVWMLMCLLILLAVLVYGIYQSLQNKIHPKKMENTAPMMSQSQASSLGKASYQHAVDDARQFVFERTPRIQGLPHTAPRYDEITKPTIASLPAACVANEKKCSCFTQQATLLQTSEALCRHIVAQGFFVDFDVHGSNQQLHNNMHSSGNTLPQATTR